jgi:hypothetical protein
MGLKTIPNEVVKQVNLLRLRLDFNDEINIMGEGIPKELKGLRFLSMRACKIKQLPTNVSHITT